MTSSGEKWLRCSVSIRYELQMAAAKGMLDVIHEGTQEQDTVRPYERLLASFSTRNPCVLPAFDWSISTAISQLVSLYRTANLYVCVNLLCRVRKRASCYIYWGVRECRYMYKLAVRYSEISSETAR